MTKVYRGIIGLFLIVTLIFNSTVFSFSLEEAESSTILSDSESGSTSEYVIVAKNEKTVNYLEQNYNATRLEDSEKICTSELTCEQAKYLQSKSSIVEIEEDIPFSASSENSDALNEEINQWYLDADGIDLQEVETTNLSKVKVALIDSGISYTGSVEVKESVDYVNDGDKETNPLFLDETSHGTAIANIICSNGSNGLFGINPNIELYSAKVLDENNSSTLSKIIQGISWAVEQDVDIINLSLGTSVNSELLHNAIKEAHNNGILIIAAAGNSQTETIQYPAAYNEVVAVGSVNEACSLSEYCSVGSQLEILAPGEKIMSTGFIDVPIVTSGTSVATAQVTAIASLLWQKDLTKSSDFIRQLLTVSAKNVEESDAGLIDYDYASEIYDEYAQAYNDGEADYSDLLNDNVPCDYSQEAEAVAGALWSKSDHENIVDEITDNEYKNASKTEKEKDAYQKYATIREYSTVSDKCFPPKAKKSEDYIMTIVALHGAGNYVSHLKYLWYFATFLGRAGEINSVDEMNAAIISARNSAKERMSNDPYYIKKYSDPDTILHKLIVNSGTMIKTGKIEQDSKYVYVKQSNVVLSAKQMKYRAMGYMFHLLGDVYAHQAAIPTSVGIYVNYHTDLSTLKSRISRNDVIDCTCTEDTTPCSSCNNLKSLINKGDLRFVNLVSYISNTDDIHNNKYIDCVNFCSKRYAYAIDVAKKMYSPVIRSFDWKEYVVPDIDSTEEENEEKIKLYELQSHVERSGFDFDDAYSDYST